MYSVRLSFNDWTKVFLIGLALVVPISLCGCDNHTNGYMGPVLAPADIGLAERKHDPDSFIVLQNKTSTGRFPTAIAVARVEPTVTPSAGETPWHVVTFKDEKAAYWNSLFNTTPEIREVMVLNARTPLVRGQGIGVIASSARRLNAGLCLVYGPAHAEVGEAALIGHLLDAQTGESLACLLAHAGRADFETAREDRQPGDMRHQDVEYLAARKFERLFHQCMIDLLHRDLPSTTTRPSKWQGSPPPEKPTIYLVPEPLQ